MPFRWRVFNTLWRAMIIMNDVNNFTLMMFKIFFTENINAFIKTYISINVSLNILHLCYIAPAGRGAKRPCQLCFTSYPIPRRMVTSRFTDTTPRAICSGRQWPHSRARHHRSAAPAASAYVWAAICWPVSVTCSDSGRRLLTCFCDPLRMPCSGNCRDHSESCVYAMVLLVNVRSRTTIKRSMST